MRIQLKKSNQLFILLAFIVQFSISQTVTIKGQIVADDDLENIHVLNKTSLTNATTDSLGVFKIKAKQNDTIVFSGVQYQVLVKVVSEENIKTKTLRAKLELFTNDLDEVFLTKQLSGDLTKDVSSSTAKADINFYDVGIPGYKGKPLTQNENRLNEAGGNEKMFAIGLGAAVNFNKFLNTITGRTKMLKERVRLESNDALLARLKNDLIEDFFTQNPLPEEKKDEFFYYCQEDPNFRSRCTKSNLEALQFFTDKYNEFIKNVNQSQNDN
ncbi:hypothetical protein [Mesoflavibacter sp.]|uniref:hypothetical protein n=1 Tax=Mesoflavibacter sp. TaxID=1930902 RepID=UPI003511A498